MKKEKPSSTVEKGKISKRDSFNEGFQRWVSGREKTFLAVMFLLCILSFGALVYNRFYGDVKQYTFSEVMNEIRSSSPVEPGGGINTSSLFQLWEDIQKDEETLEVIELLQYELTKQPIDTVKIKELFSKLKPIKK